MCFFTVLHLCVFYDRFDYKSVINSITLTMNPKWSTNTLVLDPRTSDVSDEVGRRWIPH